MSLLCALVQIAGSIIGGAFSLYIIYLLVAGAVTIVGTVMEPIAIIARRLPLPGGRSLRLGRARTLSFGVHDGAQVREPVGVRSTRPIQLEGRRDSGKAVVRAPEELAQAGVNQFLDFVLDWAAAASVIVIYRGRCPVIAEIGQAARRRGLTVNWRPGASFEDGCWVLTRR